MFQLRQSEERLLQVVEAELEKRRLFDDSGSFFKHLGRRGANDGDADFTDTGTKKLGGYAGHIHSHVYNRGILQTHGEGCKFSLKYKEFSSCPCNVTRFRLFGCARRVEDTRSRRYISKNVTRE
jgi:hypothetical protein